MVIQSYQFHNVLNAYHWQLIQKGMQKNDADRNQNVEPGFELRQLREKMLRVTEKLSTYGFRRISTIATQPDLNQKRKESGYHEEGHSFMHNACNPHLCRGIFSYNFTHITTQICNHWHCEPYAYS